MAQRRNYKRFEDADTKKVYYAKVDVSQGLDDENFENAVMQIIVTDGIKGWKAQGGPTFGA
jgi:hypothetical protein